MIRNIRHKGLRRLYERDDCSRVPAAFADRLRDILAHLDVAQLPEDMDQLGYRLHRLSGDRREYWSVTVSRNWRVTFRFTEDGGDVADVEFEDYH